MLVSYKNRFLFIHIEKAAGSSIRKALGPFSDTEPAFRDRIFRKLNLHSLARPHRLKIWPDHALAKNAQAIIPPDIWSHLFKFTIVRNPWDREVSLYRFLLNLKVHRPDDKRYVAAEEAGSFENFIKTVRIHQPITTQWDYISDSAGEFVVDYVARMENLDEDFHVVEKRIGITTTLPKANTYNLPQFRKHKDFRGYYNEETKEIVARLFQKDIEVFGYNFENQDLQPITLNS